MNENTREEFKKLFEEILDKKLEEKLRKKKLNDFLASLSISAGLGFLFFGENLMLYGISEYIAKLIQMHTAGLLFSIAGIILLIFGIYYAQE